MIKELLPKRDKTPKENAISVADGMAQPFKISLSPKLTKTPKKSRHQHATNSNYW